MQPLAFGAALAAGLALAGEVMAAPRVMSVDSCADQFVIALSPRDAIVGVSARADDPDSYMREQARGLPQRRATTETVLSLRPDVVVRYWGGDARLSEALTRRGVAVVPIEDAQDFDQVRANVRAVLDQRAKGEALIAGMDARLARSKGAWDGRPAMYLTPTGYSSGGGTLIDAMLRAAGLTNLVSGPAWEPIPLEAIVRGPPSAFVLGFFSRLSGLTTRWGPGRHRVLQKRLPERTIASLPGAQIGCPAWFVGEGVETLARAAPRDLR
ncbi:MAG: ABC transporter substrate-binding protein [Caulobacter sp.]